MASPSLPGDTRKNPSPAMRTWLATLPTPLDPISRHDPRLAAARCRGQARAPLAAGSAELDLTIFSLRVRPPPRVPAPVDAPERDISDKVARTNSSIAVHAVRNG